MHRLVAIALLLLPSCTSSATSTSVPTLDTIERTIGTGNGPIVVLLHGYGATPEGFLGLADRTDLPAGTLFVLPRAPLPIPGRDQGSMWWLLPDDLDRVTREPMPGIQGARARVRALLDRLTRAHAGRPLVLGGFSQGAMTSLDLALHDPRPLAGLALMSGTMIDERDTLARLPRRSGQRVYVSHGTRDDVLRYDDDDARLVDRMRAEGLDVRFATFDGGHVITEDVSTDLAAFITRVASRP